MNIKRFENDSTKMFEVELDATWTSHLPAFNYDVDISSYAISKAMASQSWSREYFINLKK